MTDADVSKSVRTAVSARGHACTEDAVEVESAREKHEVGDDSSRLTKSLERESDDLWKNHRPAAVATLTLPVWQTALIAAAAWLWGGSGLVSKLFVAASASIVAGRFLILGGDAADQRTGLSPLQLALLVLYLDTIWAIVLTWHAGVLFHLPWVGSRLKAAVQEGSLLVKHNRWMRRLTFAAVLCFVMLPVSSTGSIGGSLLGRLLGLSRKTTLILVLTGSVLGCSLMYAGAEALRPYISDNSMARYAIVAMLAVFFVILSRRYRRSITE